MKLSQSQYDEMMANNPALRKRNVAEFAQKFNSMTAQDVAEIVKGQPKRVRQSREPNKLERDWAAVLRATHPGARIREQAMRLKLCNGASYKPDVVMCLEDRWTCFEIKGGRGMKGQSKGILALKMAATQWPEFDFWLVWLEDGRWCEQKIKSDEA